MFSTAYLSAANRYRERSLLRNSILVASLAPDSSADSYTDWLLSSRPQPYIALAARSILLAAFQRFLPVLSYASPSSSHKPNPRLRGLRVHIAALSNLSDFLAPHTVPPYRATLALALIASHLLAVV